MRMNKLSFVHTYSKKHLLQTKLRQLLGHSQAKTTASVANDISKHIM